MRWKLTSIDFSDSLVETAFHLALITLCIAAPALSSYAQDCRQMPESGRQVVREMRSGDKHEYCTNLETGRFVHIVTEQMGFDVVVSLTGPNGAELFRLNNPNGVQSPETLLFLADSDGEYRLTLTTKRTNRKGSYRIKVANLRDGTDDDRLLVLGMKAKAAGDAIMDAGGPNSARNAAVLYENAAGYFRKSVNKTIQASLLRLLGDIYADIIHNPVKAREYYHATLTLYCELDSKRDAAEVMNAIGITYENVSEYETAVEWHEKAGRVALELGDKPLQARVLNQLGRAHGQQGDLNQSLTDFKQALQLNDGANWSKDISVSLLGLAIVYNALGNSERALAYAIRNVNLLEENGARSEIPSQLLTIGNIYLGLENFPQAAFYYQKALDGFEQGLAPVGTAYALANLGEVSAHLGNYQEALEYFARSMKLKSQFQDTNPNDLAGTALVNFKMGNIRQSLDLYGQALRIYDETNRPPVGNEMAVAISQIYFSQGDFDKSLEYAEKAVARADQFQNPSKWAPLAVRGRARKALGDKDGANRDFESAIGIIETLQSQSVKDSSFRASDNVNRSLPYLGLMDSFVSEGKAAEAFYLSEKLKARSLLEILFRGKADITKSMSEPHRVQERMLKLEITRLNRKISGEEDATIKTRLTERLRSKRLDYEDLMNRISVIYPTLKVLRGEMAPISLRQLEDLLPGRESVAVSYSVTGDAVFIFVISRNQSGQPMIRAFRTAARDLESMIESFRSKLETGGLDFQRASQELYAAALKPAEAAIAGKTHIVIVPDGPLWNLPFQALMDDKGKYLIEKAAISYAPSLTALREMRKRTATRNAGPGAELLAFGNPTVGKEIAERVRRVFMSEKLDPIPEAERLVNELAKMYGPLRSKVYTGTAAREEVAKTESPKYRIVQFATHGILNDVSPMYSQLVLAQDAKNPNEDGLLEAWELKDLDLKADMVILSACDTARGRISAGEGIIGMTWAAFIAGAPTTVASQWKVESSSTTELMLEFHRQLLGGKSKAEALRRAQLKLMRSTKYRHPSYWGAWVIVGDGS